MSFLINWPEMSKRLHKEQKILLEFEYRAQLNDRTICIFEYMLKQIECII